MTKKKNTRLKKSGDEKGIEYAAAQPGENEKPTFTSVYDDAALASGPDVKDADVSSGRTKDANIIGVSVEETRVNWSETPDIEAGQQRESNEQHKTSRRLTKQEKAEGKMRTGAARRHR